MCAQSKATKAEGAERFWEFAPKPPMGWNSWDCFATTVTETQTKAQAEVMASKLKQFGWEYVVVDIQWYEPNAKNFDYRAGAKLSMDRHGRLTPAVNRFPSSGGDKGFAPLAQFVHSLGLKFGIHLMRGIPRQAVKANVPILGTDFFAKDVANPNSVCPWNTDMYGLDMSKPGAQAYYDSVFQLIASWGVDFVKVDDLSRPYFDHAAELEGIRKAIDKTGRKIVLSLSPGETPLDAAIHVAEHANMWRISDDFWDSWPLLRDQFERCHKWSQYGGAGHFPDADMLPIGHIRFGEWTKFTVDEQRTLISFWSIVRSPLILGCDLTLLDDHTLELITNQEILKVNQEGSNPRQMSRKDDEVVWISSTDHPGRVNVGFFNLSDSTRTILLPVESLGIGNKVGLRNLWSKSDDETPGDTIKVELPPHGSALFLARQA